MLSAGPQWHGCPLHPGLRILVESASLSLDRKMSGQQKCSGLHPQSSSARELCPRGTPSHAWDVSGTCTQ